MEAYWVSGGLGHPAQPACLLIALALHPNHAQGRSKRKAMTVHLAKGENRLRRETPFNYRVQFRNDLPPVGAGWGAGGFAALQPGGDVG